MQCRCGQMLPNPPPRFCPQCGTETATLFAPAAAPQPVLQPVPQPTAFRAGAQTHRPLHITLGLVLLGLLLGGAGGSEGFLSFVAVVLLLLDTQQFPWYAGLPVWFHRPRLGTIAAALFVLTTVFGAGMTLGFPFLVWGTWRFLKDAFGRGELGPFDPRLLVYGWRILLLVGIMLASFTFSTNWEHGFGSYSWTSTETIGSDRYWVTHPGQTFGGDSSARDMGISLLPSLLMAVAVGWAAWRGSGAVPRWFRYVPLALAGLMVVWGLANYDFRSGTSGVGYDIQAVGPALFLLLLSPFYVGAVMLALGFNHWRRGA